MTDNPTGKNSNPYRRWQIQIFASTWLAYAGYYFCRKAFFVVKADLEKYLDLTTSNLAQLGTAYLASYMLGQFITAYLGRKLGPKIMLLVGMGISLACNFIFGVSNSFWTIMVFMAVNGLAQGTGWPGCIGSLGYWFKRRQRGSILGIWSTCYQLGSVLAASFAAFMLGAAGWRWSFFGASLVLLAIWFVVLMFHPNRPEDVGLEPIEDDEEPETSAERSDAGSGSDEKGLGWSRDVVTTIIMMGAIYFCIKFLRYALMSWTPYFLEKNFHLAGDQAGYLSTVFDICGFGGVMLAGYVSDKYFKGRRAFITFVMILLMTLAFAMMAGLGATSLVFFTISLGLAGFMLYGPDSLLSGVGAIDVGSRKGALVAAGLINGMGSIGPIVQELMIGSMYDSYNQNLYPVLRNLGNLCPIGQEGPVFSHCEPYFNSLLPILLLLVGIAALGSILMLFLWLKTRRGKSNL